MTAISSAAIYTEKERAGALFYRGDYVPVLPSSDSHGAAPEILALLEAPSI